MSTAYNIRLTEQSVLFLLNNLHVGSYAGRWSGNTVTLYTGHELETVDTVDEDIADNLGLPCTLTIDRHGNVTCTVDQ